MQLADRIFSVNHRPSHAVPKGQGVALTSNHMINFFDSRIALPHLSWIHLLRKKLQYERFQIDLS